MKKSEPEIITFGCRLNSYESEVIREQVTKAGLQRAIVVNSCAVTGEAVRQSRQTIRRLRRENPDACLVVTGCAAQIDPAMYEQMAEVDFVIGNGDKLEASTWQGLHDGQLERVRVNDIFAVRQSAPHLISGFGGRARAYVQVQNGCDHRCTFCIIPFGRGHSRSVPAGDVLAQVQRLVDTGFAEIVLTGVDITSYGPDLPGKMSLGRLCAQILRQVPQLARLRISSIDALASDETLLQVIADEPRFMPHLHLSLQAGDDMILKRMKRRHDVKGAVEFCQHLRQIRPDMVLGADLIAGFPTESEEMFANTLSHIIDCDITYLHVFPFSARKGTPAADMPAVNGKLVKQRARSLRECGEQQLQQFLTKQVGTLANVLVEGQFKGRTEQFAPVKMQQEAAAGELISVRITGVGEGHVLQGEKVS